MDLISDLIDALKVPSSSTLIRKKSVLAISVDLHAGDEAVPQDDFQASEDSEDDEVDMDRVESHRRAGPRTAQQPQGACLPAVKSGMQAGEPTGIAPVKGCSPTPSTELDDEALPPPWLNQILMR